MKSKFFFLCLVFIFGLVPLLAHAQRLAQTRGLGNSPVASVSTFGARGNDSKDDTQAIQAALTFLMGQDGGVLLFSPGTYYVSQPIVLTESHENITLRGVAKGSVTIAVLDSFRGGSMVIDVRGANNFVMENLAIDGGSAPVANLKGVYVHTHSSNDYAKGCLIRDNLFSNMHGSGVFLVNTTRCRVEGNTIYDMKQAGIIAAAAGGKLLLTDLIISNNYIHHIDTGDGRGLGIKVQGDVNNRLIRTRHVTISGNHISHGQSQGIITLWADNLHINDNTVHDFVNTSKCAKCAPDGRGILLSAGTENASINGNRCYNNLMEGINLDTVSDGTPNDISHNHFSVVGNFTYGNGNAGVRISNPSNVAVTGNFCRDNKWGIMYSGDGTLEHDPVGDVYAKGFNVVITGNVVERNQASGITISGVAPSENYLSHFVVSGNIILNNNTNQSGAGGGLVIARTRGGLVTGNYSQNNFQSAQPRGDYHLKANQELMVSGNYGRFWFSGALGEMGSDNVRITNHQFPTAFGYLHDEPTINNNFFKLGDLFTIKHLGLGVVFVTTDGHDRTSGDIAIAAGYVGQTLLVYNRDANHLITLVNGSNVDLGDSGNLILGPKDSALFLYDGAMWRLKGDI